MDSFTPVASTVGGVLIGISASLLLLFTGRITGISGILSGALRTAEDGPWRRWYLAGLVLGAVVMATLNPDLFANTSGRSVLTVAVAGLLVGYGTRLGSGCTSGHGVCGLARLSPRSLVATLTFIGTGVVTVTVMRLWGGA